MQMDEYQYEALHYAVYDDELYPFLALCEEAGEVIGKIAKLIRKKQYVSNLYEIEEVKAQLKKELGDVLWNVANCCAVLDTTLQEVAEENLDKLADRAERGVIVGEGDNR